MSTYYDKKVVDKPASRPAPFKFNGIPRGYKPPTKPIPVDNSGTVVARQIGGGVPRKPYRVTVISEVVKPASVSVGVIPEAPASVSVLKGAEQPASVSVLSSPKQPISASVITEAKPPASVSVGVMPNAPAQVSVGALPEDVADVTVLAAPKKPDLVFAFEPFVVEIMETEDAITARPASTPEGTVAFGTDTKKLYVFNKTGIDSWGAFAQDGSY